MPFAGSTEAAGVTDQSQGSGKIGNYAKFSLICSEIAQTPLLHTGREAANHERTSEKMPIHQRKGRGGGGKGKRRVESNSETLSKNCGEGDAFHVVNCSENRTTLQRSEEREDAAIDAIQDHKQDELSSNSQVNHSRQNASNNTTFNHIFYCVYTCGAL